MYAQEMRTTIELPDRQRAQLLELAARRGLKGFSQLVQEALDRFLQTAQPEDTRARDAVAVLGTMTEAAARRLETSVSRVRAKWR